MLYSHSQLDAFEKCPYKYRLRYIERVRSDVDSIEAFMGDRVHKALEALYRDVRMGKVRDLRELIQLYDRLWDEAWHDRITIVRDEYTAEDYRRLGARSLSGYYERYFPFDQAMTIDLERRITIDLMGGKYKLQGFIDRLALAADNELEIHDYKSSQSLPSQEKLEADRQLALYQIGVEQMWPTTKKVDLVWHYLVFDQELRSRRTPEQLQALEAEIAEVIDRVEAATTAGRFEAQETHLCDWCEYRELCPKRRHIVSVGALPENAYLNDDGVKLVNRYAELEAERQAIKATAEAQSVPIEAELEKVKEAAAAYAAKIQADVLAGTGHLLKIKTEAKERYPLKNDAGRAQLDELLKAAGLWERVADLNTATLVKLAKEGKLTAEILAGIEGFKATEVVRTFSLSKLKNPQKITK